MPEITIDLIRRKAEHNEGLIHTLEELSLHQEELESINETLGCNCRRLKILYLQNNIIPRMQNLRHMKELEYLNLALNNITKIEGLQSCEFLNKLDLTVNFIDLDELETSIDCLSNNLQLKDLYLMGNPCQAWEDFEAYVIGRLPQLERLDGKEVTRTDRIRAQQQLPRLIEDLSILAEEIRQSKEKDHSCSEKSDGCGKIKDGQCQVGESKGAEVVSRIPEDNKTSGVGCEESLLCEKGRVEGKVETGNGNCGEGGSSRSGVGGGGGGGGEGEGVCEGGMRGGEEGEEMTKHTPEARTAIYREVAEQKREKEERQREHLPLERDFNREQEDAVRAARARECEGVIRQCNEGKWEFSFKEVVSGGSGRSQGGGVGSGPAVVLEVSIPRFLDSSLIDLDVHPHYVSVVIKGKVLRLTLPTEVKSGQAKAQRSKTTGSLVVTMPKLNPEESIGLLPASDRSNRSAAKNTKKMKENDEGRSSHKMRMGVGGSQMRGGNSLAAMMMVEARAAAPCKGEPSSVGGNRGDTVNGDCDVEPSKAVSIRNLVKPRHGGVISEEGANITEAPIQPHKGKPTTDTNSNATTPPAHMPLPETDSPNSACANSTNGLKEKGERDSRDIILGIEPDNPPPPPSQPFAFQQVRAPVDGVNPPLS